MTIKKLYRYRGEGGAIDTTVLLPMEHEDIGYRISAEGGKVLTNGDIIVNVRDIPAEDLDKWTEINAPVEDGESE